MKEFFNEEIEIITPCFCAGADQAVAEIRAPSIRGELRWWFRALGGGKKEEQEIFGGIAGEDGKSSALVVRVADVRPADSIIKKLPTKENRQDDDPYYLLHFAKASGEGVRYQKDGFFSPGTQFRLKIFMRRSIAAETMFQRAFDVFLRFGAIGLRSNRACGAFYAPSKMETFDAFSDWVKTLPENIQIAWLTSHEKPKFCSNWNGAFRAEAKILKSIRKNGYSAGEGGNMPSPLGRSQPRQGSAVRLRPVQLKEGILPVVLYVPDVLGEECRDPDFKISGIEIGADELQSA